MSKSPLFTLRNSLVTTGLLLAFSTTAAASPLSKADTNNDGTISYSEFTAKGAQHFSAMDTDANGLISDTERSAFRDAKRAARTQEKFAKIDANSDGFISNSEFTAAAQARSDKRESMRETRKAERQANRGDRKAKMQERRKKMMEHGKRGGHQSPDTNGDGMMDRAEHDAMMKRKFERLDKNNDGQLDASEQKRAKKHGGKKHHGSGQ